MRMDYGTKRILDGKTIVVTGSASGIGLETAHVVDRLGGTVLGIDYTKRFDHVEEFYRADLSDRRTIDALIGALPDGIDGIANIAGLPPTAPAEKVIAVNLVGLKHFTEGMIGKLRDGASIVNVASLAGFGWPQALEAVRASSDLAFEDIDAFVKRWAVGNDGGRSYFFSKEALVVWTMQNRWRWRDRGIRMNAVSPGPVETPILKDFLETLGERAATDAKTMDRPGQPEDIAPVVAFMLSDMSRWLRGVNIPCDGGMSSHLLSEIHGF